MVTPTQQRLHDEHKARQARLQAAAYVPPPPPPPPPSSPPKIRMPPKKKPKPAATPPAEPVALNGSLETILNEVASKHDIDRKVLMRERDRMALDARFEYYYRARVETNFSTVSIARLTGHDHTSVLHGARQHAARFGLPLPTRRYGGWRGPL